MKITAQTISILFVFFTLCLLGSCSPGQTKKGSDQPSRIDSLITFYKDTISFNPARAQIVFLKTRTEVTESIDYYKLTLNIGICYYQMYKIDSALSQTNHVLDFCGRQPSAFPCLAELEAHAYNNCGIFLQEMGKRDSAIACLQQAYNALYRTNKREKLPDVCINLADNYAQKANFPLATTYYRRALVIADSLNTGKEVNHAIYCGLARIYADLNNFRLAESYYRMAEKSYNEITPYEQYQFANTRGNYYYITKEYEKALKWFYLANTISKDLSLQACQAIADSNLGEIYLLMSQTDSARYYLDKAGEFFLTDNANYSSRFYFNGLYASLALQENDLTTAEKLLSRPYSYKDINPTYIYFQNKRLEELYSKKGDYRKAYKYMRKVKIYDDSIRDIKALNNIAEIDSRYRQDTTLLKRDILLSKEKSRSSQLRNINILSVSLLLIVVMATIIIVIYTRKKREQKSARQIAVITRLRMENIRNRISPHHIFNVLNAVMPALNRHEQLTYPLRLLIQSIRKSLVISEQIAIPLKQEIEFVKDYLELRRSIGGLLPEIKWEIASDVNMQALLPSMIIQIPVENSVKYAFDFIEENNRLLVVINKDHSNLLINIEDNGRGFSPDKYYENPNGTGTGLKVLYHTIELLNTRNRQKIIFKILNLNTLNSGQNGTCVQLIIPLDYNFNI